MQPILMQLQVAIRKPSTKTNSYSYQVTNSFSAALKKPWSIFSDTESCQFKMYHTIQSHM